LPDTKQRTVLGAKKVVRRARGPLLNATSDRRLKGRAVVSGTQAPTSEAHGSETALLRLARAQRADLRAAMLELEHALARPAPGRVDAWSERVHDALIELAATFERHIAVTEGDTGFLAEIRDHSPRLINAIERLRAEHERIRDELSSTLSHIRRLPAHAAEEDVESLRAHVTELVADLVRHRQHGADLVWEAHAVDIGGWE
jgi:hypothetical protein